MFLSVLIGQFPVSFNIDSNLDEILAILKYAKKDDLVIFPEGAVSGYDTDLSFLERIDKTKVKEVFNILKEESIIKKIHIWVGSCLFENDKWYNAAIGFSPQGDLFRYNKVNLATHERGVFRFGSQLEPVPLLFNNQRIKIGVQLCRDLKYPEQWRWLAQNGVKIFLHLNNAKGNSSSQSIWKSQLISRATENQRYVISVNTASSQQKCPTIIINPNGEIIHEINSSKTQHFRTEINLDLVSDWYIKQSRNDLIKILYNENDKD